MLGLTLLRPWEAAILHLGKPLENRKWHPAEKVRDTRIALHAGQGWEQLSIPFIERYAQAPADEVARRIAESNRRFGVVVGTAYVIGWWRVDEIPPNPWALGPWCWGLADVFALPEPVPCKGALGLWRLPVDVEAKVLEQEKAWASRTTGTADAGTPSPRGTE